jgi:hypothetical protein
MRPSIVRLLPRVEWDLDTTRKVNRFAFLALFAPALRLAVFVKDALPPGVTMPLYLITQCLDLFGLIVLMDTFQGRLRWGGAQWVVLASIGMSAIVAIGTGLASGPLWLLAVPILAYITIKRRVPWLLLTTIAILFVPVLAFRHEFRQSTGWNEYSLDSSFRFVQLISRETEERGIEWDKLTTSTSDRFMMDGILAHVVSKTPQEIPFWKGETYLPALSMLIPRAIWPGKPALDTGQQFGHRYSVLDVDDWITSVNLSQLIEVYVNFGAFAMIPGMFLIGLLELFVWRLFDHGNSQNVLRAMGLSVLTGFLIIESSFTLAIGSKQLEIPIMFVLVALVSGCGWSQLPSLRRGSAAPE